MDVIDTDREILWDDYLIKKACGHEHLRKRRNECVRLGYIEIVGEREGPHGKMLETYQFVRMPPVLETA